MVDYPRDIPFASGLYSRFYRRIEAMACGTPVVSTDCPFGPAEILDRGRYGTLVPVGDEHALADAMLHELERPHSPVLLRERAEDFSLEGVLCQYEEVLYADRP